MTSRYLDPTNDIAFHRVFSDQARMKSFLNAILCLSESSRVSDVEFIPQDELPDLLGIGKRTPFTLKVNDVAGNRYVIEVQNRKEDSVLEGRQLRSR